MPFHGSGGPIFSAKTFAKNKVRFLRYLIAFRTMEALPSSLATHRVGYARVSSVGQNLDSQIDALQKAGCKKTFSDKMTGSRMDRPGWDQLMEYVRPGDVLVVTELSRMTVR